MATGSKDITLSEDDVSKVALCLLFLQMNYEKEAVEKYQSCECEQCKAALRVITLFGGRMGDIVDAFHASKN